MHHLFIVKNVLNSCKKVLSWLQLLIEKDINFPQIHQIAKNLHCFQVADISVYKHIVMTFYVLSFPTFYINLV